jgi:hypothetical protein
MEMSAQQQVRSVRDWLEDALGRYQVTHIHSSIREAIKVMDAPPDEDIDPQPTPEVQPEIVEVRPSFVSQVPVPESTTPTMPDNGEPFYQHGLYNCRHGKSEGSYCQWCKLVIAVPIPESEPAPTLRDQVQILLDAINWACGSAEEEFAAPEDVRSNRYWWRIGLTKRAGLIYNGQKYVIPAVAPPTSPETDLSDALGNSYGQGQERGYSDGYGDALAGNKPAYPPTPADALPVNPIAPTSPEGEFVSWWGAYSRSSTSGYEVAQAAWNASRAAGRGGR